MKLVIGRNSKVFGGMSKIDEGKILGVLSESLGWGEGEIKSFVFEERFTLTRSSIVDVIVYDDNKMPRVTEQTANALQKIVLETLRKIIPEKKGVVVHIKNERKVFLEICSA